MRFALKEKRRLERLKTLRSMYSGNIVVCKSLDAQIENLNKILGRE